VPVDYVAVRVLACFVSFTDTVLALRVWTLQSRVKLQELHHVNHLRAKSVGKNSDQLDHLLVFSGAIETLKCVFNCKWWLVFYYGVPVCLVLDLNVVAVLRLIRATITVYCHVRIDTVKIKCDSFQRVNLNRL